MKTLIMLMIFALTGCASNGHLNLPSIECRGKGTITGTGSASVMVGSASNNFSLQADCGDNGFTFRQAIGEALK